MAKKRKIKNGNGKRRARFEEKKPSRFALPEQTKRIILLVLMCLCAVIVTLSFFDMAGTGGEYFKKISVLLLGKTVFILPLFLIIGGFAFFRLRYKNKWPVILAISLLTLGTSAIFECLNSETRQGGWVGYLISLPFLRVLGTLATQIIFASIVLIGSAIIWQFLQKKKLPLTKISAVKEEQQDLMKKIFGPKFKVKSLEAESGPVSVPAPPLEIKKAPSSQEFKTKPLEISVNKDYHLPPADLLESDRGVPSAGDIKINSTIIKRTLQNFDIQVEMSEVNIGPTVTQYTLKPAEGVKLSKITTLNNDLSLALASHPLRIEAPIPGRPLVGIEVPNKTRTVVRLRNLIENQNFQNASSPLTLSLGRDVAGNPIFADLARMPHLLVAGATGTGKTICLNSIITSLLYQCSPDILKLILIDPKRVEFPVYNELPHLLTPVILDSQKAVNAFRWLITEMERRFDVLSQERARDILSYNESVLKAGKEPLPYIVLIVDELADLMMARGRDVEASIVRLAQMSRAVGIHLILATQRPSVEVITGLIKANITSRITFQVASQIDSRTILDSSGAEKLLGAGDMLFVSAEISKPRRIQAVYVSDKEVKKIAKFIKTQNPAMAGEEPSPAITQELEKTLEQNHETDFMISEGDPLYEEAKKLVIDAKKASASLLQRRLRVGYARAARLIDILEERGVVGPGEGAKPREILVSGPVIQMAGAPPGEEALGHSPTGESSGEEKDGWQKI
ncbi:MAG: DNA translocase FtsK 4TM domain-containing protein [Candidatus Nealsonbacteria bacterium]